MKRDDSIINKISLLVETKNEWYILHSKIMRKYKLDFLDKARARRCRVEIVMLDKRISNLKELYRNNCKIKYKKNN